MCDVTQSKNRRILVIDDNQDIHNDFRKVLAVNRASTELDDLENTLFGTTAATNAQISYAIDSAFQGEEGLRKVRAACEARRPYAMAFVDMRMPPGWDGLETIEHLWQVDRDLQVVICTAYSDHSWGEITERIGQTDRLLILKKPFDNAEVCQLAAALTEKHFLAQAARWKMDELERMVQKRTEELTREIAERERAQRDVLEKDRQLRHKQRLEVIGSLAGGVAHEFNNLLQSIQGYTKYAMEELAPDSQPYQDLTQALGASQRAAKITAKLLTFSRRDQIQREPVAINNLISEQMELLRPVIGSNIRVEVDLDNEAGTVCADRTVLEQALMNLCVNGRDAMTDGGQLQIRTRRVVMDDRRGPGVSPEPDLKPGRYVVLAVEDSGCGMTPEVQERMFDPFYTTKEVGKGTGMGLAMVHGAVEQHEGAIRVHSQPGKGTTFEIYLPVPETGPAPPVSPLPAVGCAAQEVTAGA